METHLLPFGCALLVVAGCAADPGTQPHDMSVAGHEAMAKGEERIAAGHAAQFDPAAGREKERCQGASSVRDPTPCWTSTVNPTSTHLADAERHRELAAKHRAASQALRDAEARACAGLADADRDMSPFEHREDIASVQDLTIKSGGGKTGGRIRTVGAVIVLRAVPGLTSQWLQRTINCHLARNAALGHEVPEMPSCPLVPNGVSASVAPTETGFAVAVQSEDDVVVQEVLRRARSLVAH
jgi:hypothetical protein